jgi:hypothetical protein
MPGRLVALAAVAVPLVALSQAGPGPEPLRGMPRPPARDAELVSHYPLDRGDFRDAAGDADGKPSGRVRAAEDRRGDPGGAAAFAGREHLDLGVRSEPERFTIAAWVRVAPSSRDMVIFSKLSTAYGPRERWLELRLEPGGRVALSLPSAGPIPPTLQSLRGLAPGRWSHVAATFDGERAVVYVDGEAQGEAALPAFEASRGAAFLAARPDFSGRRARLGTFLEGRLDDVRLYRGAIPAHLVAQLADRAPPPPTPYPGPGRDDDEASNELLVRVGRELVRFDAAVARRDHARIASAEERALKALDQAADELRGDRGAGPLVQRIRRTAHEIEQLRGRFDAMSLDRKRSALASLADTLWDDLVQDIDERPF